MENQDTMLTRQEPSLLEEIVYTLSGAASGAVLAGAFLYNPILAAGAGAVVAGAVGAGIYLTKKPSSFSKRLIRNFGLGYVVSVDSVLGGNYLGDSMHSPRNLRHFQTENYQGIVVETRKDEIPFILRDGSYIQLTKTQEEEINSYQGRTTSELKSLKTKHSEEAQKILRKENK